MDSKAGRSGEDQGRSGAAPARKRPAAEDEDSSDDEDGGSPRPNRGDDDRPADHPSAMSRSERKRHREKKRRSDVNKGFDELMSLLIEVDPDVRAESEERSRRGVWKGSLGAQDDSMLSRVELISRTVAVLRRINGENEQRKALINHLLLQRGTGPGMDVLGRGAEAPRLGSMLPDSLQQLLGSSGLTPISSATPSAMSQLLSSYNAETALTHLSINHLLAARQAQVQQPPTLESVLGLGSQHHLAAAAAFGQPQPSQFSISPEQLLALRLLQEQERQRSAASNQRDGSIGGEPPSSRGGNLGR